MSLSLCLFVRGKSPIQPPEPVARVLHFIGRHTLEIYAIQLAGSELLVKLVPASPPDPRPLRAAGHVDSHPQGRGAHQVRNGDRSQDRRVLGLDVLPRSRTRRRDQRRAAEMKSQI